LTSALAEIRSRVVRTPRYRDPMKRTDQGRPAASPQPGVLLVTSENILSYLQIYVHFLHDMAAHGFNPERGKDPVGVAITRNGTIVKVNRGLHRLAMAQRLGLPSIPVQVRHVHRIWWDKVTEGASGAEALAKMAAALKHCVPEEHPGPLD